MPSCTVMSDSLRPCGAIAYQAPLSIEFSRQEYWSTGEPLLPGALPNPGIKLTSFAPLHWQAGEPKLVIPSTKKKSVRNGAERCDWGSNWEKWSQQVLPTCRRTATIWQPWSPAGGSLPSLHPSVILSDNVWSWLCHIWKQHHPTRIIDSYRPGGQEGFPPLQVSGSE